MDWLEQQGPWSPGLIEYLRRNQQQYDVLVFFTISLRDDRAGSRGQPREERARLHGARRAGHTPRDLTRTSSPGLARSAT